MRHLLVASANETLLEELRAAAPPSVTLLAERGDVDSVLERLSRSSRMDAVLTDVDAVVLAVRAEIPGDFPVVLARPGVSAGELLEEIERFLGDG